MAKSNLKVVNKNFNENKPLRVAVYTRVSTNDQYINGVGIEAQFKEIKRDLEVYHEKYTFNEKKNYYKEGGQSGADEHRPELDRMIRDIDNGEIDIIIVYKIDRLFRKLLYLLQFIEGISKKGVFIKSINDKIDTTDNMGMVMLQFMGIIGDIERDNIRIRTIDGKKTKAEMGYYVGGGKTPFGYDLHDTPGGKKLKINDDEAKIVRRIFDMYVNQKNTLGEMARILTMEGIPTRDDRLKEKVRKENLNKDKHKEKYIDEHSENDRSLTHSKGTKKNNDGFWYSSSIRKILNREIYTGVYYYGMTTKEWDEENNKTVYIKNPKDIWIPFECPDILNDKSLYEEAQKLLEKNKILKPKSPYLFTGLIKCGECHKNYNGYKSSKGSLHYRCKGGMSGTPLKNRCKNSEISEDILFKYCWGELERNLSNPDNFKAIAFDKKKNKEIISKNNKRISEIASLINSKRNTLVNAIKNEAYAKDDFKRKVYSDMIVDLEKEISKLEVEDKNLRREISIINSNERKKDDIANFNEEHQKAIEGLTDKRKKQLIVKYIDEITKNVGKIKIRFNILDDLKGKDWRDGEEGEDKKLKSEHDFFDKNTLSIGDKEFKIKDILGKKFR
ncbi:MAG: recombinase family protein [Candidatus Gracilibacteria bacterium]|nr:recombinase family protein [Candidatus Gracilibacteria bacterium]